MTSPGPIVTVDVPAPADRDGKPAWMLMNHRKHWRAKAPITKTWRTAAAEAAQPSADLHTYTRPVHITITAHRTGRQIDADAIAPTAKACIDGLVDAHLLIDDKPKYVPVVTYRTAPKSTHDVLELRIEEAP